MARVPTAKDYGLEDHGKTQHASDDVLQHINNQTALIGHLEKDKKRLEGDCLDLRTVLRRCHNWDWNTFFGLLFSMLVIIPASYLWIIGVIYLNDWLVTVWNGGNL